MYVVNSISQTLSKINLENLSVLNNFNQIGLYGNDIGLYDNMLYVLNSGDDEIQVIDSVTGNTFDRILLENSSNPYKIIILNDFAYVSCWATGNLAKIDLNNTNTIEYIHLGSGPQGMLAHEEKMYVALSGYPVYNEGIVKVVDLHLFEIVSSVIVQINPQEMIIDNRGYIHVICTGDFNNNFSKIVIFDSRNEEIIDTIVLPNVSFFTTIQKSPNNLIFVGNFMGLGFLTYDINSFEIYHSVGNFIFQGGNILLYDHQNIYVLHPGNYFHPSTFAIYNHEYSYVNEVTVGVGALAMTYKETYVSEKDIILPIIKDFVAYPNPFDTKINFKISRKIRKLDIFNIKGQKICSLKNTNLHWNGKNENGTEVQAGIYFVRLIDDNNDTIVKKILKKSQTK